MSWRSTWTRSRSSACPPRSNRRVSSYATLDATSISPERLTVQINSGPRRAGQPASRIASRTRARNTSGRYRRMSRLTPNDHPTLRFQFSAASRCRERASAGIGPVLRPVVLDADLPLLGHPMSMRPMKYPNSSHTRSAFAVAGSPLRSAATASASPAAIRRRRPSGRPHFASWTRPARTAVAVDNRALTSPACSNPVAFAKRIEPHDSASSRPSAAPEVKRGARGRGRRHTRRTTQISSSIKLVAMDQDAVDLASCGDTARRAARHRSIASRAAPLPKGPRLSPRVPTTTTRPSLALRA